MIPARIPVSPMPVAQVADDLLGQRVLGPARPCRAGGSPRCRSRWRRRRGARSPREIRWSASGSGRIPMLPTSTIVPPPARLEQRRLLDRDGLVVEHDVVEVAAGSCAAPRTGSRGVTGWRASARPSSVGGLDEPRAEVDQQVLVRQRDAERRRARPARGRSGPCPRPRRPTRPIAPASVAYGQDVSGSNGNIGRRRCSWPRKRMSAVEMPGRVDVDHPRRDRPVRRLRRHDALGDDQVVARRVDPDRVVLVEAHRHDRQRRQQDRPAVVGVDDRGRAAVERLVPGVDLLVVGLELAVGQDPDAARRSAAASRAGRRTCRRPSAATCAPTPAATHAATAAGSWTVSR